MWKVRFKQRLQQQQQPNSNSNSGVVLKGVLAKKQQQQLQKLLEHQHCDYEEAVSPQQPESRADFSFCLS